jgi:hypothetical protein
MYGPFPTAEAAGRFWAGTIGFWFLCGVLSIGIASWKGRTVWFWAMLGFLFGPVGLGLLLLQKSLIPAAATKPPMDAPKAPEGKKKANS